MQISARGIFLKIWEIANFALTSKAAEKEFFVSLGQITNKIDRKSEKLCTKNSNKNLE